MELDQKKCLRDGCLVFWGIFWLTIQWSLCLRPCLGGFMLYPVRMVNVILVLAASVLWVLPLCLKRATQFQALPKCTPRMESKHLSVTCPAVSAARWRCIGRMGSEILGWPVPQLRCTQILRLVGKRPWLPDWWSFRVGLSLVVKNMHFSCRGADIIS